MDNNLRNLIEKATHKRLSGEPEKAFSALKKHQKKFLKDSESSALFFLEAARCSAASHNYSQATDFAKRSLKAIQSEEAFVTLINAQERSLQYTLAQETAEKALANFPNSPKLSFLQGKIALRLKEFHQAESILKEINTDGDKHLFSLVHENLGEAYDKQGKYEEAFRSYLSAKSIHPDQTNNVYNSYLDILLDYYQNSDKQIDLSDSVHSPICFLIGFPRSGTTLLESRLNQHPRITTTDEEPWIDAIRDRLAAKYQNFDALFTELSEQEAQQERQFYFNQAKKKFGKLKPDNLLIDKLPLNIISVPLILKIFPQAKFILALRHPLDCCLSAFMQSFQPNPAMDNFNSVEATARIYDKVFRLWDRYKAIVKPAFHTIHYESFVSDTEEKLGALCGFLELDLMPGMASQESTQDNLKNISTPSYHQVSQSLYASSSFRWKNYDAQLDTAKKILAVHITNHGYEV